MSNSGQLCAEDSMRGLRGECLQMREYMWVCVRPDRIKLKQALKRWKAIEWSVTTGWDWCTIPKIWMNVETQEEKERSLVRREKKRDGLFVKGSLNQAPPFDRPPCCHHPTHTHPKQRPTTQHRPLSHTARHITDTFTSTSTHFLSVFSLMCQWKCVIAKCGALFVCLLVFLWSPCQLPWIWSLERRIEDRKMKSKSDEEGGS